jgi:hypothetical protein
LLRDPETTVLAPGAHRRIKRRTRPMLGFQGFWTAQRTLARVEARAMLSKGHVRAVLANDVTAQLTFMHQVFGLAACQSNATEPFGALRVREIFCLWG